MPKPGERTCINEADNVFVEYEAGCIVLEGNWTHGAVYLDQTSMDNFDKWRAELNAEAAAVARGMDGLNF